MIQRLFSRRSYIFMHSTILDIETLRANLEDPNWITIDCRFSLMDTDLGTRQYAESHIPQAHYAHLDHDLSGDIVPEQTGRHPLPSKAKFAEFLERCGVHEKSQIIAYDDKVGGVASRLWWLCQWIGHKNCAVLNGGFAAWTEANFPISDALPDSVHSGKVLALRESLVQTVSHDDVQRYHGGSATAANSPYTLLDAREAVRYKGFEEPIDRVAGHIPGALNAPFMENVEANGLFKSAQSLRARFENAVQAANNKSLVHYCGSGVTAAHNILAMTYAGLNPGSLYPGSYSEWTIKDAELCPVADLRD